jgi:hypothetical protein
MNVTETTSEHCYSSGSLIKIPNSPCHMGPLIICLEPAAVSINNIVPIKRNTYIYSEQQGKL